MSDANGNNGAQNNESQGNGSQAAQQALNVAKDQGQQALQNLAKEGIKKGAAKAAGNAAASTATTGVLATLAPIIAIVAIVIIILIIVVGILGFFLTMPGMMSDKLKSFGESIASGIRSVFFESRKCYY